jgi:hypothetical protein
VTVCGFARVVACVVAGYVTGLSPGGGVIPGCTTGFPEHPDKITKAITRPVNRENTILLFNPASLPYYSDEFYGPAGKYIFTVSPGVLMKTRRPPVATGRYSGMPVADHPSVTDFFPPKIRENREWPGGAFPLK